MMSINKKIDFEITCVVTEEVGRKLNVVTIEDALNQHLQLSNYGTGITKLFFVFIAVPPENTFHESKIKYSEAERHLEIALKLDYEKLLIANDVEARQMMKELFLEGIELCEKGDIEGFDFGLLDENVNKLL